MKNSLQSIKPQPVYDNPMARLVRWLDRVPYTLLAIPLRIAVATVFWNSAMTKLANWATAMELFREEYKVPFLPPELAAYMAVRTLDVQVVRGRGDDVATAIYNLRLLSAVRLSRLERERGRIEIRPGVGRDGSGFGSPSKWQFCPHPRAIIRASGRAERH